jgi:hypothetical protein
MSGYTEQLQALHDAMVHKQSDAIMPLIKPSRHNELSPQERLAVYADGYDIRLIDATLADYPALAHYMGADECRAAIAAFVSATPSTYLDLNCYPVAFADFLKGHSSDKASHALADLESAIAEVFWLPESQPLMPDALAGLSEDALGEHKLLLRAAAKLLKLDFSANDYLTAFRAEGHPKGINGQTEYLLVIRLDNEVKREVLEPMEHTLLYALGSGLPFNEALNHVTDQETLATKLPHYIARWLQSGFLKNITT